MPKFISKDTIKAAVERLTICTAKQALGDYLNFKRAAVLTAQNAKGPKAKINSSTRVVTGTKSKPFVAAIHAFALVGDPADESASPYFIPFGAKRDSAAGYKTYKYPSNGSSDTVWRWQNIAGNPLVYVSGTSPKAYTIQARSAAQLVEFFFTKHGPKGRFSDEKPRLADIAIWWFRNTQFKAEVEIEELVNAFIADFQLSPTEVEALFQKEEPAPTEAPAAAEAAPAT